MIHTNNEVSSPGNRRNKSDVFTNSGSLAVFSDSMVSGFFDFAGSDACGADFFSYRATSLGDFDGLYVGVKYPFIIFYHVHSDTAGFFS